MQKWVLQKWVLQKSHLRTGFTIVELLVVIVVIAILAAITIVAYNGITSRSIEATMKSDLRQSASVVEIDNTTIGAYPNDAASANAGKGLLASGANTLRYRKTAYGYCMTVVNSTQSLRLQLRSDAGRIMDGQCTPPYAFITSITHDRVVTLDATPGTSGSPISRIEYRIGDGAWVQYNTPFAVAGTDMVKLYARAVDSVGDTSNVSEGVVPAIQPDVNWTLTRLSAPKVIVSGEAVPGVFAAKLTDASGNGIAGATILFTASGGVFVGGSATLAMQTDGGGLASTVTAVPTATATPGDMTVTASYKGYSMVIPVATVLAPSSSLDATATAATTTVSGKVSLTVTATNTSTGSATIKFESKYGTKTFASVAPGQTVTNEYKTPLTPQQFPAGSVTVRLTTDPLSMWATTLNYDQP